MTNNHPDQIDIDIDEILKTFVYLAVHGYGVSEDRKPYVDAVKRLVLEARISTYTKVQTSLNAYINGTSTFPAADELLEIRDRISNLEKEIEGLK